MRKEIVTKCYIGSDSVEFLWFRKVISGGSCEHGREPQGSIKGGELLD